MLESIPLRSDMPPGLVSGGIKHWIFAEFLMEPLLARAEVLKVAIPPSIKHSVPAPGPFWLAWANRLPLGRTSR